MHGTVAQENIGITKSQRLGGGIFAAPGPGKGAQSAPLSLASQKGKVCHVVSNVLHVEDFVVVPIGTDRAVGMFGKSGLSLPLW